MKTLIIMRGLPGSGKSTTVARLVQANPQHVVVCAIDDYFTDTHGVYRWSASRLGIGHQATQAKAFAAMQAGLDVIVDNVNGLAKDMKPYVVEALRLGYDIRFIDPHTAWAWNPAQCAHRNRHNVPLQTLQSMLRRWEWFPTKQDTIVACLNADDYV